MEKELRKLECKHIYTFNSECIDIVFVHLYSHTIHHYLSNIDHNIVFGEHSRMCV